MSNGSQRPPTPLLGAGAALLVIVALLFRRKKRSRSAGDAESISNAAGQVKDAGGHALGKAASAARDLTSHAADLVGDRHLNETLDRLQSALDDARSAATAAVRKAPIHRH
jgi:LPXTG-motif cell wall-anchored protein